ncbi:uncharacterized protein LOC105665045 [Ceratitis capitata]|uniref:uncharacterized protein LOC105665045 n=1 Tax=Ceratitis capitata TaxID=7213 RepID=UPI0006187EEA|nr:uncharacterized protein LOC105665045 [Ceratitis capitata]
MSYTKNRQELKCKFMSCPCQKCVSERADRLAAGLNPALCDVPPERPACKYTQMQENKDCCKPHSSTCTIGPRYRRKYRGPARQQRKADTDEVKKNTSDDCNSGKGCCNLYGNFTAFMIHVISFMAFTLVALLSFEQENANVGWEYDRSFTSSHHLHLFNDR